MSEMAFAPVEDVPPDIVTSNRNRRRKPIEKPSNHHTHLMFEGKGEGWECVANDCSSVAVNMPIGQGVIGYSSGHVAVTGERNEDLSERF